MALSFLFYTLRFSAGVIKCDMEKKTLKKYDKKQSNGLKEQNEYIPLVRKFEPDDNLVVQQIFYEGLMEMVPDTAFRGLRHHPESLWLYAAMTGKITYLISETNILLR